MKALPGEVIGPLTSGVGTTADARASRRQDDGDHTAEEDAAATPMHGRGG